MDASVIPVLSIKSIVNSSVAAKLITTFILNQKRFFNKRDHIFEIHVGLGEAGDLAGSFCESIDVLPAKSQ